jgi:hypothetical protein
MSILDESEGQLLNSVADLLYPPGDPRAIPWPSAEVLGHMRSRLRSLADDAELVDEEEQRRLQHEVYGTCVDEGCTGCEVDRELNRQNRLGSGRKS